VARSHLDEGKYLCRYHSCNEILMRLCEIFEEGKKQDLTLLKGCVYSSITSSVLLLNDLGI